MNYLEVEIDNWSEVFKLDHYFLSQNIFRGQSDSNWKLSTAIERAKISGKYPYWSDYVNEERWMIDEFKRKFHLYNQQNNEPENNFEYLAIMQHYGAPTRLLDFSESFFIALYFAIMDSSAQSTIFAVNHLELRNRSQLKAGFKAGVDLKDTINNCLIEYSLNFIGRSESHDENEANFLPLFPNKYSQRISRQQGLFLFPTNSKKSFEYNLNFSFSGSSDVQFKKLMIKDFNTLFRDEVLSSTVDYLGLTSHNDRPLNRFDVIQNINVVKFNIASNFNHDILNYLKHININAEILFPGLEGLAKSLVQSQIK